MLALVRRSRQGAGLAQSQAAAGRRPRHDARLQARRGPATADRVPAEAVVGPGRPWRGDRAGARAPGRGRRRRRDRQAEAGCRGLPRQPQPRRTPRRAPRRRHHVAVAPAADRAATIRRLAAQDATSRRWRHRRRRQPSPARFVDGGDRRQRGHEPARRAVPIRRRIARRGVRLLGPHQVRLGSGRRVPAPPVGRAVRLDTARHAERDPTGRPHLLQVARSATSRSTSVVAR